MRKDLNTTRAMVLSMATHEYIYLLRFKNIPSPSPKKFEFNLYGVKPTPQMVPV